MKTPKMLGRYRIISEISHGAMGRVYLAHDPSIDRRVAIKTVHSAQGLSVEEAAEARRRFAREAQAAGRLQHPGIVTIYDVGVQAGVAFIAMEYIEGITLEEHTTKPHLLPPARVVRLIAQACEALDYAHQHQVVHRDIKPANLMLLQNDRLKITDFGLAKNPATNLTQNGTLLGTPNYMSPEQIMGKPLDGRSDLFSLAAVLYEMLAGVRPFEGDSVTTIIYRILHEDPRELDQISRYIPEDLVGILLNGLEKDPARRFQTGREFAGALLATGAAAAAAGVQVAGAAVPRPAGMRPAVGAPSGPPVAAGRPAQPPRRRPRQGPGPEQPGVPTVVAAPRVSPRPARVVAAARWRRHAFIIFVTFAIVLLFPARATREDHWGRGGADGLPPFYRTAAVLAGQMTPAQPETPQVGAVGGIAVPGAEQMVEVAVRTRPAGATIYLDDRPVPDGVLRLAQGDTSRHTLVAENDCFIEKTDYRLGDKKTVTIRLKTPKVASLTVGSTPSGARILLDGKPTGKVTPAKLPVTRCDPHKVRLSLGGYEPVTRKITDPRVPISFKLKKIPKGFLRIASSYPITIYEAGRKLGRSGDRIALTKGRHKVRLVNKDLFLDKTISVVIRPKATTGPRGQLPGVGRLTVLASPSNCNIFINDRPIGVPPINDYPLAEGTYKVRAVYVPTGEAREASVTIIDGAAARVPFKFHP